MRAAVYPRLSQVDVQYRWTAGRLRTKGLGPEYEAVMIDQGFCFNGQEWNFPDSPLRDIYYRTIVYNRIASMDDFEPWLTRLESEIGLDALWRMAQSIPSAWYSSEPTSLARLLERLDSASKQSARTFVAYPRFSSLALSE